LTTAATVFGGLASLIPAFGGNALRFAAAIDALILGFAVLMGRGCTGEGLPQSNLRGVLQIARGLAPAVESE
jgi:hypothetical protein